MLNMCFVSVKLIYCVLMRTFVYLVQKHSYLSSNSVIRLRILVCILLHLSCFYKIHSLRDHMIKFST